MVERESIEERDEEIEEPTEVELVIESDLAWHTSD